MKYLSALLKGNIYPYYSTIYFALVPNETVICMYADNTAIKQEKKRMAFTTLKVTQNEFLVSHLRGTGVELSAAQAEATYGIKNLRARIAELRAVGLKVNSRVNYRGAASYSISARLQNGSRAKVAV